jgi:hypothetical protein
MPRPSPILLVIALLVTAPALARDVVGDGRIEIIFTTPGVSPQTALDPELDDAEYVLAECLGKTGDAYGQWWHLGRAYELRGDIERATNAYERARDRASEGSDDYTQAVQALRMLRETFGGSW